MGQVKEMLDVVFHGLLALGYVYVGTMYTRVCTASWNGTSGTVQLEQNKWLFVSVWKSMETLCFYRNFITVKYSV